jgi:hypothetical protein
MLIGLGLHSWRFYDALIAIYGSRRDPSRAERDWRWPRASSDRDFVAQAVIAVAVAALA